MATSISIMTLIHSVLVIAASALAEHGSREMCSIEEEARLDCGVVGTDENGCIAHGCCWEAIDPNPHNTPWCFRSKATMPLSRVTLEDIDARAVCNDGSPAGYYWKPASSDIGNSTFIFYLEGGDWCYDDATCRERCGSPDAPYTADNKLCSSKQWPRQKEEDGIFSSIGDEKLREANKVFVHYCTSDGHMGDGAAFGWQFRGSVVVQAILKDLVARRGLGSGDQRQKLIFGGGSAGARGAMVHLDYVEEMLGEASKNVDIMGFLDSPLYIDVPPFAGSFPGFAFENQQVYRFANISHLGSGCEAQYDEMSRWKCIFGEYRMPFIRTPYLLVASQFDSFQLGRNGVHGAPSSDTEWKYAEAFRDRTLTVLKSLRANWPKDATQQNAVFSWSCYSHCMSGSESGFNRDTCAPGDTTMDSALQQFAGMATPRTSPPLQWIDTCTGWACGNGCHQASTLSNIVV